MMTENTQTTYSHLAAARFSSLGDVILISGPLLYWRQNLGCSFTVITSDIYSSLFDGHPAVERVIGLSREQLARKARGAIFRQVSGDLAGLPLLDLHGNRKSGQLAKVWQGPVCRYPKKGLQRRIFLWSGGRLFSDSLLAENVPQRYWLAMPGRAENGVPQAGALRPRIFLTQAEQAEAEAKLAGQPGLVALHPFATHPAKAWPLDSWLRLAGELDKKRVGFFWVGRTKGNPPDLPGTSFINASSLRQTAALLNRAAVLVTGDSGPMHLAAAVQTPVVALFGPTVRQWGFFPAGERDIVLEAEAKCRPCSLHGSGCKATCLAQIKVERVLDGIWKIRGES